MTSALEKLEGLQRRLKITVASDRFEKEYQDRLKTVANKADLKGFRKGKVPINVVEDRFGSGVLQEVAGELMQTSFEEAIKENDLKIAGMPRIEPSELKKGQPLEYVATFEIYPEIDLKDLTDVNVEKEMAKIAAADVDKMLENIQQQHADWIDVERASQNGDRVTIDFEGFVDGKPFEGGKSKDFQLELGSGQMIPGFEDGIVGAKTGQELDIKVTFPKEYPAKDLAGKESLFKIKVHKVQVAKRPALDDALAARIGIEGGMDQLRNDVKKNMQAEMERIIELKLKNNVFEKLMELNPILIPDGLIDSEVKHLQHLAKEQIAMSQGKRELPDVDLPKDPYIPEAKKRVTIGLLLAEVIKKFDIKLDQDKVRERVNLIAKNYEKPEEVVAWYYNKKRALSEIEAVVLEEQVVTKLLETATIKDKEVSYEKIMKTE